MRNWLIKQLGGFTASDLDTAERSASDLTNQIERGIAWLQESIERKDQEITRLSDLIFRRAGFMVAEQGLQSDKEKLEPINRRPNWLAIQKGLEANDAKLAAEQRREMPVGAGNDAIPSKPKPKPI